MSGSTGKELTRCTKPHSDRRQKCRLAVNATDGLTSFLKFPVISSDVRDFPDELDLLRQVSPLRWKQDELDYETWILRLAASFS